MAHRILGHRTGIAQTNDRLQLVIGRGRYIQINFVFVFRLGIGYLVAGQIFNQQGVDLEDLFLICRLLGVGKTIYIGLCSSSSGLSNHSRSTIAFVSEVAVCCGGVHLVQNRNRTVVFCREGKIRNFAGTIRIIRTQLIPDRGKSCFIEIACLLIETIVFVVGVFHGHVQHGSRLIFRKHIRYITICGFTADGAGVTQRRLYKIGSTIPAIQDDLVARSIDTFQIKAVYTISSYLLLISIRACGLLGSQHRRCRDLLCLQRFSVLFYCAAIDAANTSRYFRSIIVGFLNRDCRGKAVVEVIPVVVVGLQFLAQRVPRIYRNRRNRVDCIEYLMIDADELVVGIFPGVHGSLRSRSGSIHFLHGQRVTRLVDTVGTELIMAVIVHRCRDFNFVQICTRICFYNAKSTTLADSRCLENLGQINAVFIGVGVRCSKRILVIGVVVVVMRCLQRSSICESIAQNDFRRLGIQGFEDIIHSLAIDTGGCDAVRNDQLITSWVSNRHIRSMILASNDRFARIHCNSDRSRIACLERYCCARCLVFINRNICTGRNRETAIARVGTIVRLAHLKSCRKRLIVIIGIIITNSFGCADRDQPWCRFVDVDGIADFQFRDKTSGGFFDIKLLSAEDIQTLIRIRFAALQCDILRWLYIIQRIAIRRGQHNIAVIPPDFVVRILGVCALRINSACVIAVDVDHFRIGIDRFVADTVVQVLFLGVIAPRSYRHRGRILSKFFLVFIRHRIIRAAYQSCFFGAVPI